MNLQTSRNCLSSAGIATSPAAIVGHNQAAAERSHVIADLNQYEWTEGQAFPWDEQHYQRTGSF
jgi:hypothetical protein